MSAGGPTLGSLCHDLGAELLDVALAPRGLDVPIAEPVVHDPGDPLLAGEGDIVLAVGLDPGDAAAGEIVAEAGASSSAAVVLKRRAALGRRLTDAAGHHGVALLTTATEVAWGQLYALIRTSATAATGASPAKVSGTHVGDLFALADAIASAAGGPVTIEDPRSHVLAFSNLGAPIDGPRKATILGRQVPEDWMRRLADSGVLARLHQSDGVIPVEFPGEAAPRRAIAVRGGGALIASIWVAEGEAPLSPTTDAVLEEAARIAALHLLRHRVSDDLARRVRGELLRALLRGEAAPDAVARELGLPRDAAVAVVAIDVRRPAADEPSAQLVNERLVNLVAVYLQSFRRKVSVASVDGRVYVLVVADRRGSRERFVALVRDAVTSAAKTLGVGLRAGVGPAVDSPAQAPRSRAEADQALRVGERSHPSEIAIDIEAVRGQALLLDVADALGDGPRPRSRELAALEAHDDAHGTDYVGTLRAYLDVLGSPALTASRLGLHPNTVRYRMRRISDLTGVDLADADRRFPLELELRLVRDAA